ncbi:hypothetical protein [Streptomyces melanogenes]|uniref:PPM-type phosphatase domain-containing protein n=1 Tax=Streptomyces melanogenes TaxID=67326 RepID=A0ABZ1XU30_9ACTN|nr:hypothetical protein [Streptomyces melanogenes]
MGGSPHTLCVPAGCSSSDDYTVPDALCGVTVGSEPLAPLLPDGEKSVCSVSVDKKQAVYVTDGVTDAETDPVAVQRDALARMGNPQKAAVGDDARIADQGGVAVGVCTYQGRRQKFVTLVDLTSNHPVPKRTADRRKALESFLRAYLPKAMEAKGCRK